jgi:hypothetical protein
MRTVLIALFLAAALPAAAGSISPGTGYGSRDAPRDIDSVGLGHAFCAARLLNDMSRVEHWFAPKLQRLLARAKGKVPWQSVDTRPTGCDVAVINGASDTIGVLLVVNYSAGDRHWSDTLNLQRTPDSWWIDNVFYEGGGNLRFRLFMAQ